MLMIKFLIPLIFFLSSSDVFGSPKLYDYNEEEFDLPNQTINDPLENLNRKIFCFNKGINTIILTPTNKLYRATVPSPLRMMVHNFFDNLSEPINFINALLELDKEKASRTLGRFLINSTWGLAGIHDVGGYAGMKYEQLSFGKNTLNKHGIKQGPYLVLPIIGPSSLRDGFGYVVDTFINPFTYTTKRNIRNTALAIGAVDKFDRSIDTLEMIEKTSLDEYAAIRNMYTQKYR